MDMILRGDDLKRFRYKYGVSYSDISKAIGCQIRTLSKFEKGESVPKANTMYRLNEFAFNYVSNKAEEKGKEEILWK